MTRRRILLQKKAVSYTIIVADTACVNGAEIWTWLESKGYTDKCLHLNKCVGTRPNNQFFAYNDPSLIGAEQFSGYNNGFVRIRDNQLSRGSYDTNYDGIINIGDEYLLFDKIEDLLNYGLVEVGEAFSFTSDVGNCAVAKTFVDSLGLTDTGIFFNNNRSAKTTTYDCLQIWANSGVSTQCKRYNASTPTWGAANYDLHTYPADIWTHYNNKAVITNFDGLQLES